MSESRRKMVVEVDEEKIKELLKKNLVLNETSSSKGNLSYHVQREGVPDLLADPIKELRKRRLKRAGEFIFVELDDEKYEVANLREIQFPAEYEHLLALDELTETTLFRDKNIWKILMNKPLKKRNVIEKQTLLICLNWAQAKLYEKEPIIDYALLKYTCHSVEKSQFGKVAIIVLELRIPNSSGNLIDSNFRKGALLKFKSLKTGLMLDFAWAKFKYIKNKVIMLHVYVYNLNSPKGKSQIEYLSLLDNEEVIVFENQPDFIPQSMLRSIERIKSGELEDIITPGGFSDLDSGEINEHFGKLAPTLKYYTGLNTRQCQFLYSICTSTHAPFPYLLQGPPGSGKTKVISSTVRCLLEMHPKIRVLLTAPSNMAADMIALKVMEQFDAHNMNSSNVLRLRSIGNDYFGRNRDLDSISCMDSAAEMFKIPEREDFDRYRVVICTLGCSTHIINKEVPPGFFSHIFLDEAGQAGESEIWIPLGGLAKKNTSVIFCGDQKQLGPVNKLNLPLHVTKRFDSALVRYTNNFIYKEDGRLYCLLRRSYRCHKAILYSFSSLFYENKLKSGIKLRPEMFEKWSGLPQKGFPILFVNVNGKQFMEKGSNSYGNNQEVTVTMKYVRQILKEFSDLDPSDIGVISPYRYQVQLLLEGLRKIGIDDRRKMTIDSVERFQGSERKVIIISTTRTSGLGFVGCDFRLNTSISRAMNLLVVIGNKDTLYGHLNWGKFIDYCEENGSLIDWNGCVQSF